ncbi:MAG: hypothetical protein V4449_01435 [Patescibacteria group bacterium]
MSGNIKVAIGVVLVAVVIGGLYYWYSSTKSDVAPAVVADQTATPAPTGPTLPSGSDTSDTALGQDVASVDADVSAMTSDTASIDSGMNDTAVQQ